MAKGQSWTIIKKSGRTDRAALEAQGGMMRDVRETIPGIIAEPMARCPDYPDYPAAWAIQKDCGSKLEHHPRCSSVPGWHPLSGPRLLCDCGAVEAEWQRLATLRAAHAFLEGGE